MPSVRRGGPPDPEAERRLYSVEVEDWIEADERAVICGLVEEALRTGGSDPVYRLAPGAAARLVVGEVELAVGGVESTVVAYRRRRAGRELAEATGRDLDEVVQRFQLGHLSAPDVAEGPWWRAARRIA